MSPPRPDLARAADGLALALGETLALARPSGALWLPGLRLLAVGDLHLGRSERVARLGGALLPPYETDETLARLEAEIAATAPAAVVLIGDSFDDGAAAARLGADARARLARFAAGRRWVWLAGNHDPAPPGLPGETAPALTAGGVEFRHIADPASRAPEVSGHYHPKATLALRGRRVTRRCFVHEGARLMLPAFGAYAGGLDATDPAFDALFGPRASVLLLGRRLTAAPRAALAPRAA
jgi:DNA ligase-associated metallophosphoesterase